MAALTGCALAVSVCGEQGRFGGGPAGPGGDTESPVATVVFPGGAADTVVDITDSLRITARATDNVRVATVRVQLAGLGGFALDTVLLDSTVAGTVTDFSKAFVVPLPAAATGRRLAITVTAVDGSSNTGTATVNVVVEDPQPPVITVREPSSGVVVPAGGTLQVVSRATDPSGIRQMGARLFVRNALGQPIAIAGDSTTYASRLTTRTDTFQVAVPDTLNPGSYLVHAFGVDSSAALNDTTSADITITVADTTRPFGTFSAPVSNSSVVAGDSVLVTFRARDLTGVASVTFRGVSLRGDAALGTDTTVLRFSAKTATFPSQPSDTTISRFLNAVLSDSTVEKVFIEAAITDVGGNAATVRDSVQIVAGPFVRVSAPASGSRQPVGVALSVTVIGRDPDSVKVLGFTATGAVTGADSVVISSPLQTTDTTTLALAISATAPLGVVTVTPFARDRLGNRFAGSAVVVSLEDTQAPTVTINQPSVADFPVTVGDSVLMSVRVQDNRGVSSVVLSGVARRGVDSLGTDTTVARFTSRSVTLAQKTDTTILRHLRAIATDVTSERVLLIATAGDSSGNTASDTATVRLVSGPFLTLVRPTDGAVTSVGKSITIEVRATDPDGVRIVGWRASGVVTAQDSVIRSPASGVLADTTTFVDTLTIPSGTAVGTITITPFGLDSLGDLSGTVASAAVTVQSAVADATPPYVRFAVASRVEVDDSISVTATDASGITRVGWVARALGSTAVIRGDSASFSGNLTDVTRGFQLNLDTISTFPRQVTVEAFAVDSVNNRGVSSVSFVPRSTSAVAETLTVAAGKTIALPSGGQIADAIYNRNRNELYLSNIALNRIEVFQLSDSSFVSGGIPVGSRPFGLALWPRDTLATTSPSNNVDTLIVANSGGTNLSIVDVAARVERRRHRLPNYLIQKVKTSTDDATGAIVLNITEFDFSDRPQFVATACRNLVAGRCATVLAAYSTSPTTAQGDFPLRGYLAWEDLTAAAATPSGHFFFEQAIGPASLASDTLQIISVRDTAPGQARRDTIFGGGIGTMADFNQLSFQDTTFVRNSGDFNHVLFGEGGLDQGFARALTFDARAGTLDSVKATCPSLTTPGGAVLAILKCRGTFDRGISEGIFVRDFLANRASRVLSIATNFNGRTNLVRADSIYAFDFTLRLTGLLQVAGTNPGMDFDPDHTFDAAVRGTGGFGGTADPNDRLIYAARPDAGIDVFDTFFYGLVTTIPVRDPIIGPLRVAKNASGQQLLIGTTASGIVIVRLPSTVNIFPVSQFRAGSP
ncbi:MAG: hypothetical protein HY705_05590 [Gemmatimonadetes bacterium]|nr:hypothetical protein [Gemmatimonadota bacterium]